MKIHPRTVLLEQLQHSAGKNALGPGSYVDKLPLRGFIFVEVNQARAVIFAVVDDRLHSVPKKQGTRIALWLRRTRRIPCTLVHCAVMFLPNLPKLRSTLITFINGTIKDVYLFQETLPGNQRRRITRRRRCAVFAPKSTALVLAARIMRNPVDVRACLGGGEEKNVPQAIRRHYCGGITGRLQGAISGPLFAFRRASVILPDVINDFFALAVNRAEKYMLLARC